jgi:hypothetical protein
MVVAVSSRPCTKCGIDKPVTEEFYRKNASYKDGFTRQCIDCRSEYRIEKYHSNPKPELEKGKDWTSKNRDRVNELARLRRWSVLQHYSGEFPMCACCGEDTPQFLSLDHIDGGGNKQRRELGGGGYWSWFKQNDYPEGYQVLCHNCNLGREMNKGICPHEKDTWS